MAFQVDLVKQHCFTVALIQKNTMNKTVSATIILFTVRQINFSLTATATLLMTQLIHDLTLWGHVLATFVSSRRLSDRRAGFLFVEPGFTSSSRSCIVKAVVSFRQVALRRDRID